MTETTNCIVNEQVGRISQLCDCESLRRFLFSLRLGAEKTFQRL